MEHPRLFRSRLFSLVLVAFISWALFVPMISAQEAAAPPEIIDKARRYIISEVGEDYFNTHFTFRDSITDYRIERGPYRVDFHYNISAGNYATTETVMIYLDSEGNVTETIGVPTERSLMPFKISREDAIRIAKKAGLPEAITGYDVAIHYYGGEIDAYVWCVGLSFVPESVSYTVGGAGVAIDANSGKVYGIYGSQVFTDPPGSWIRPGAPFPLVLISPLLALLVLLSPFHIEVLLCLFIGYRLYKGLKHDPDYFPGVIQKIIRKTDLADEKTRRNIYRIVVLFLFLYGFFLFADELTFALKYFQVLNIIIWLWITYRSILGAATLYLGTSIFRTTRKTGTH